MDNNTEEVKEKKDYKVYIVGALIVIILLVFLIFIFSGKDEKENKENKDNKDNTINDKGEEGSNFSDLALKYYGVFEFNMHDADKEELYKYNKVTANELSNEYKNRLAFAYLVKDFYSKNDGNSSFYEGYEDGAYLSSKTLEKYYKEFFGNNSSYVAKSFDSYGIDSLSMTYNNENDRYYSAFEGGDDTFFRYATQLYKVEENDDSLVLYEYVVVFNTINNGELYGVYSNLNDAMTNNNSIKLSDDVYSILRRNKNSR